jgi:ribose transport system substrate-binding protein
MAHRIWRAVSLIAIASLLLGSVSLVGRSVATAHAKQLTFYLIPGISSDAFYITMHVGAKAAAAKHGITLKFQGDPNSFSAPTQIPILNAAIAAHPDAILIAPTDKVALIAPIRRAVRAGIPVILVDTTINTPNIAVTSISSDNIAGGKKAAIALARAIGMKGTVGAMSVTPGISTTDQRKQGFEAQLKHYPNIKYIGTQFDNDSATTAATKTSAMIAANPNLSGIFAMNTNSGIGVTNAAKHAGKKIKLVELDAEPVQVQALRAGTIDALVAQDPYTIGFKGVNLAYQYATGHRAGIKKHYGTGEKIITRANVNNPSVKRFLYTRNG